MDLLFSQIENWQNNRPWGSVLDAGTGTHSLKWLIGLPTERWTAVTGDINRAKSLQLEFKKEIRPRDCIRHGNWLDQSFLKDKVFDYVVADYLLGAIDGFAPYFQRTLFKRLRPHVEQGIYVVGMEPIPIHSPDPGAKLITEMTNLRDAHIRLANHRCYREYPLTWTLDVLNESGFEIQNTATFPIRYNMKTIDRQLNVCIRKLDFISDQNLRSALKEKTESFRREASQFIAQNGPITFGFDYVVQAKTK